MLFLSDLNRVTTAKELTLFEKKETVEREKAFIQTVKDSEINVYYLSEAEGSRFREAAEHIVETCRRKEETIITRRKKCLRELSLMLVHLTSAAFTITC